MAREKEHRILVATDGSRHAQGAIATSLHFPWPARTRVRAVIARQTRADYRRSILLAALDRTAEVTAQSARRTLSRRWPDVEIEILDKTPVVGIRGVFAPRPGSIAYRVLCSSTVPVLVVPTSDKGQQPSE